MINKLKRSLGLSKKQEGVKLHNKVGLNTTADYTIKPGGIIKYTPDEYRAWQMGRRMGKSMSSVIEAKLMFAHELLRSKYKEHIVVMRPPMGRDSTIIKLAGSKNELEISNTFLAEATPDILIKRIEEFFELGKPKGARVERFFFDEAGYIDTGAMEKLQKGMKINETPKSANEQWADSWAERLGQ